MLTLEEARQFYTEEELSDKELMEIVRQIDTVQMRVLDEMFGENTR